MILGIDFGLSHIGVAISEGELAEPYSTIKTKDLNLGIKAVEKICNELKVDMIVVGVSEGKSRQLALDFGNKMEHMLRLPVKFVDETLSSQEASTGKRKDKEREHERAAAIILQRYLDS